MASNSFVQFTVPTNPGTGSSMDVSGLSFEQSLVVEGGLGDDGELVLEISTDGAEYSPFVKFPIIGNPVPRELKFVASRARIVRLSGSGVASACLGALTATENTFATLGYVAVDVSAMGPEKSIVCCGTYSGRVIVEASNDGTNYDAVAQFDTSNSGVVFIEGSWSKMRLRRDSAAPTGSVSVGGGFPGQEGGAGAKHEITLVSENLGPGVFQTNPGDGQTGDPFETLSFDWTVGFDEFDPANDILVDLTFVGWRTATGANVPPQFRVYVGSTDPNAIGGAMVLNPAVPTLAAPSEGNAEIVGRSVVISHPGNGPMMVQGVLRSGTISGQEEPIACGVSARAVTVRFIEQ